MDSRELRSAFLSYFEGKGHTIVESSSLVPGNDPTLLFTNAGMVQFKDSFAFREDRGYTRAASCQRCVRAGGKHNDLDNVGYTARHHTFFEMLGNFSFGDYFKEDAIVFAWEFLTQVVGLPADKLWVTVHDSDDEAEQIWIEKVGFDPQRITRLGDDDNFWTMGDTGPCGPSSEIFYDHGPEVPGGPPGSKDGELDRYIEIWNLVFTQYDRSADGTLTPLPKQCVDTGMGLERLAAVLQDVHNNYEIDLFQALIKKAAGLLETTDLDSPSLKVIADHIRAAVFLIADGVVPSNEGRGYVIRRIIRRALRHGHKLQSSGPFFHQLVGEVVTQMGDAYPLIAQTRSQVEKVLLKEEQQFELTLDQGMRILSDAISQLDGKEIPGEVVFKLYDTYGFPTDLTADIARERNLTLDMAGFARAMEAQRQRARAASQFGSADTGDLQLSDVTEFVGYDSLEDESTVIGIIVDGAQVDQADADQQALVVLDRTPFYAESGGQAGDTGQLIADGVVLNVTDTVKSGDAFLHQGKPVNGSLAVGDKVQSVVNRPLRDATRLNHSATHLMHAALRKILGEHVNQRGSLVNAERLRFDFSHFEPVSREQLREIERLVNTEIRANSAIETEVMDLESARNKGAMALFGEKYSAEVRVLTMGDGFSVELCGGTHAARTGDIGIFRIVSEQGVASGVRRIEAITGSAALTQVESNEDLLSQAGSLVRADNHNLADKLRALIDQNKKLEKTITDLNRKLATGGVGPDIAESAIDLGGVKLVVSQLDGADPKSLPDVLDQLKNKIGSGIIVLGTVSEGKVGLIVGVTKDLTDRFHAGDLVNHIASQVGGKGGGRPDMARAGGSDPDSLPAALASVEQFARNLL
ncbi:MAG: alanine--tRNA ligase [Gammaproteobacteria bacterium]|jgi:alanyl-tRNA synthetase|nr:alanine--tRNA ligase [Gammaproteobacteria bacterium]MBT4616812.1 alanine--tRNA ligase [Gammaproteobacteria bacterium]MBT7176525.1 alanine--tRNA ligase [Gammaproteobacteria bacterium]MBT7529598.1 alanine--tRNA ligase [Gammaproteobacteria bacterium]MBT7723728.1 alanine--tRNA ligase [Gammaproteobacteria bacterium]